MKQNTNQIKIAEIIEKELPSPSFPRLFKNIMNTNLPEGRTFVLKACKCKSRNEAIQVCYDEVLNASGLYKNIGGKEVDARYIKRKDRKAGWWD